MAAVLVECRKTGEGQAWFYSFFRLSSRKLVAKSEDTRVWSAPDMPKMRRTATLNEVVGSASSKRPYVKFRIDLVRLACWRRWRSLPFGNCRP